MWGVFKPGFIKGSVLYLILWGALYLTLRFGWFSHKSKEILILLFLVLTGKILIEVFFFEIPNRIWNAATDKTSKRRK